MGIIEKIEDTLTSRDQRMLRFLAGMAWKDRKCEEIATRCSLKEIQWKTGREGYIGHVRRRQRVEC